MIRLTSRNKLPFSMFAGIISMGYQWSLDHVKIREYDTISKFIVLGSRDDLFGQNREGIFSFFGIPFLKCFVDSRIFVDIFGGIGCGTFDFACESACDVFFQDLSSRTVAGLCVFACLLHNIDCGIPDIDQVFWNRSWTTVRESILRALGYCI